MKKPEETNSVITKAASLLVIITGCAVLAGWIFNYPSFKRLIPGFGEMKFITAVSFILAGITLFIINNPVINKRREIIASFCSWIILVIGAISLSRYLFNWNFDALDFFRKQQVGADNPSVSGHMSLIVSFNFTLLGCILLVLGKRKYNWIIQALLIAIIPGSLLVILNHLFGVSFLESIPLRAPTSLHTAVLFIILAVGIFFSPAIGYLQFSFIKKMAGFFILILLFRSLIFFAINKNNEEENAISKRIEHGHSVASIAETLNSEAGKIENEINKFIITGDAKYISYFTESQNRTTTLIDSLRNLTKSDLGQQVKVNSIENYLKDFIAFQSDVVNTRMNRGFQAAKNEIASEKGTLLTNKIAAAFTNFEHTENEILANRKVDNLKSVQNTSKLFTLFQVIVIIMFIVALKLIYNNSIYRNKVEEALTKSLKDISDYKFALDESSILVITNQDGIITQVNENFCKITKYDRESLVGRDHSIINSGYHTKDFMRDLWLAISNGEIWRGEIKNKAKDGTYFWLDTTIVPFMNEHGKPYQYVAIRSDITQRKKLEEDIKNFNKELQKSVQEKTHEVMEKEQQYRFLLQNMREGIQIIGFDWKYIFVNNSALEQSKYSNEEWLGHTIIEKNPGIESTAFFKVLQRCMRDRVPEILENEFTFTDGKVRWFELSIQPVAEGLFILSMDITDRKKAKKALVESENYLRTIIETEPECVKLLNCKGELLDINPAGLAMLEADTLQQVKGKEVTGIIQPPYKKQFKDMIQNVFKGRSEKIEFEITGFKGTHRWMETNAVPLKNHAGEVISLLSVTRDITDRKKAEEKLRESLDRYELVNKATRDTIWEWDLNTNQLTWNDAFMTLYGYDKNLGGKKSELEFEYIHASDRERVRNNIKNCITNKLDCWDDEYRFQAADGTYRNIYGRGFVQYNEQGNPIRMVGAMTDLTETKRLEKELSDQMIKQQKLLTEVAIQTQEKEKNELGKELHDNINQILSTVKIYLGLLKSGDSMPQDDLMTKSYEYVGTAIDELRKLSHSLVAPSLGEIDLKQALLELADGTRLINELNVELFIGKSYEAQIVDKNIELMLYRITQEQLNNVIKYSKASSVIISVEIHNSTFCLSIADNGVGFDVSKKTKGIGFKNINNRVAFYGGEMCIISNPGEGCTLTVSVPFECEKTIGVSNRQATTPRPSAHITA